MNNSDFENNKPQKEEDFGSIKHSLNYKRKERQVRKKRKKVNRLKSLLRFFVFLTIILMIYGFFTLPGWYLPKDAFKISDLNRVEVYNNRIIPSDYIENSLKDVKVSPLPIFLMSVRPIKKELYKIPVLKTIYVRRYAFPARVQIIVNERIPIAIIKPDLKSKPLGFFTSDGVIVQSQKYMNIFENSSVLKILTNASSFKKDITVERIEEIQKIVDEVELYSSEKVEYIDMRKQNDVYVKIKSANIRLGVLDNTVYKRIRRIETILPQVADKLSKVQYIDLSWDRVNYLKLKKGAGG